MAPGATLAAVRLPDWEATMTSAAPTSTSNGASGSLKGVIAAPTAICTIDGTEGRLIYRGYSIEDLTSGTTFEEVVYLLWDGELPTRKQLEPFKERLARGREVPAVLIEHLRKI